MENCRVEEFGVNKEIVSSKSDDVDDRNRICNVEIGSEILMFILKC